MTAEEKEYYSNRLRLELYQEEWIDVTESALKLFYKNYELEEQINKNKALLIVMNSRLKKCSDEINRLKSIIKTEAK